jgi:2-dehydro-3-deoxyphosphogluconate aldolase / (4S)-4-hydroxy-2-oxoglutarate aldolase
MELSQILGEARVVPVVAIDDATQAVPLARTLLAAGIAIVEITLRTPAALESIENIVRNIPDMIVGAGSIRDAEQMVQISDAGARFAVSPGATAKLISAASRMEMPFIPGATTPSEMLLLLEQEFTLQKFFPAEASGGIDLLRAIAGPLPEIRFMPTGGISADLADDYLALPNVIAIGGSWIATPALINAGDFEQIGRQAAQVAQQNF